MKPLIFAMINTTVYREVDVNWEGTVEDRAFMSRS